MQLNDILEENSVKAISLKTKIPEYSLENLFANKFEKINKVKTLGFISIIEREYHADLSALREDANAYYAQANEDVSVTLGLPIMEEKRGKSKFFMLVVLALLAYATWYFFTQFDKKHLSEMIPFIDEETIESFIGETKVKEETVKSLSIAAVKEATLESQVPNTATEETTVTDTVEITQTVEDIRPEVLVNKHISLVPVSRLWFGVIDKETGVRDHFSISDTYALDVTSKTWLVATSSAGFALQDAEETKEFNDAKEHYFQIDKNGIQELTKDEYISLGGWPQW